MCYVDLTALHTYHYYFKYLFNMKTVWASLVTEKVKNLLATQETGLIPGEGNSYPLLFLPENSMDRGVWQATVQDGLQRVRDD